MDPLPRQPDQIPLPPMSENPPVKTGHEKHVAPIRTLSSDLAEAMREKGGSVVKIAIAEDEKHRREKEEASPVSKINLKFIIIGVLIIFIAIGTIVGIVIYKKSTSVATPDKAVLPPSIVRAESAGALDITGKSAQGIADSIQAIVKNPGISLGTMENIVPVQGATSAGRRIPAPEFLSDLGTHSPDQFSRSLSNDFMLGVYLYDHSNLFLVLRGTAHDIMLSGMLQWEPKLLQDMSPLFGIDLAGDNASLVGAPWKDVVIKNHDTRAVMDKSGSPTLFYSFMDDNTIVITRDQNTLSEAIRRLGQ